MRSAIFAGFRFIYADTSQDEKFLSLSESFEVGTDVAVMSHSEEIVKSEKGSLDGQM